MFINKRGTDFPTCSMSPQNGCTTNDVPIIINKSHVGKSCIYISKINLCAMNVFSRIRKRFAEYNRGRLETGIIRKKGYTVSKMYGYTMSKITESFEEILQNRPLCNTSYIFCF